MQFQQAKAKFIWTERDAKRKSWREKTSSLNLKKDGKALWEFTKSLNEEDNRESL